jgi:PhnB protein
MQPPGRAEVDAAEADGRGDRAMSSRDRQRQTLDKAIQEDNMAFHPYLFFDGNCREAFTRYQEIFGGELFMMKMSDAPADEVPSAAQADLIIHAALNVDSDLLMASDDPTGVGRIEGIQVSYSSTNVAEVRRVFGALAEGGEITQALAETFFSPAFGMCVDRFGTPWMLSADAPSTTDE